MKTLGVVANVFNEIDALPGWLECVTRFADHVAVYHAGPGGIDSTDGTIELLEKWKIPIHRGSIDQGFGITRTATIRASPCDYVMLMDADERFFPVHQVMTCSGESTPLDEEGQILQEYDTRVKGTIPCNWENIAKLGCNLSVSFGEVYNQAAWLKDIIQHGDLDGVCTIRRHWHDFTFTRPTQNWHTRPDHQLRLVRNHPSIFYDANTRMHESLIGASNVYQPNQVHGPFFDHAHIFFKKLAPHKRAFALRVYDAIHAGNPTPSWAEFRKEYGI